VKQAACRCGEYAQSKWAGVNRLTDSLRLPIGGFFSFWRPVNQLTIHFFANGLRR